MYIYYIKRAIDRCLFKKNKIPETLKFYFSCQFNYLQMKFYNSIRLFAHMKRKKNKQIFISMLNNNCRRKTKKNSNYYYY